MMRALSIIALFAALGSAFATPRRSLLQESVAGEEDRLATAIRKPQAVADVTSATIQFETGPSLRIFEYSVFCVEAGAGCKANPASTVETGNLTRSISTINATVTGLFFDTTYDCYVTASTDLVEKCQGVQVTTAFPSPFDVNLIGVNAAESPGPYSYFKYNVTSNETSTWSAIISKNARSSSLSGKRAALNSEQLAATGFYYVDDIIAWLDGAEAFPIGWTEVTSPIGVALNQTDMKMDIFGNALVAWQNNTPYGFWAVKDFTAAGATWDVSDSSLEVISASIDRSRVAVGIAAPTEWIVGFTTDVFASSSPSFETIISYPIADQIIIENVALSGRYLAWVADGQSGPTDVHVIYYVDLTQSQYVPVEVPLPATIDAADEIQISIAGKTMVVARAGQADGGVASCADFTTVTADSWVIQANGVALDQVDASFNI